MKRWTEEEIKILEDNYETNASEFLCWALPNRTWDAIQRKASELKLTRLTTEERFWRKVKKRQSHECWDWAGVCDTSGYGQIEINRKSIKTHRFSWEIHFGKIPDEMCILHYCDNPKCVNPNHLWLGTKKDNSDDKVNKNRQTKGEDVWCSKLTEDQVKEIRQLCCEKKLMKKEIAKMFNISNATISAIHTSKAWRHINNDNSKL